MHYSPQNEECPMALNPFKACVAPRPIGWISTVSRDGIDNLRLSASSRTFPTIRLWS